MGRTVFEHIPMSVNRNSSINGLWFDVLPVFSEPFELLVNLMSEFPGVTENECWNWIWVFLESLQNGNDKNRSFAHSRLGLTQQIVSENGVGDALLLNLRGVLEGGVRDRPVDFWQQKEIFERCQVDSSVPLRSNFINEITWTGGVWNESCLHALIKSRSLSDRSPPFNILFKISKILSNIYSILNTYFIITFL